VYHAVNHTLVGTAATKIIENQHGRAYILTKMTQQIVMQPFGSQAPPGAIRAPQPQPQGPASPNRAERRRQDRDSKRQGRGA
jgi:hypothetical protein